MTGKRKPVESLEEEDGDAGQVETVETLEDGNVIYWRPLRKDSIRRHSLRVLAHRKYRRPRSCPHLIDHIFGARITLILLFASLFY